MTQRLPVHTLEPGAATDGQVPTYDAATGRVAWATPTAATPSLGLDDLADVDTATTPPSDGQVLTFDAASGLWIPGTSPSGGGAVAVEDEGVEVVASASRLNFTGAGVAVADAGSGEVTVTIAGGGGGSGSGPLLTPTSPDDTFTGSTLPGGWSLVGYTSSNYTVHDGWLDVTGLGSGNYFYKTAPAGDFTATMRAVAYCASGTSAMFGILVTDNSGNGIGAGWYNNNPNAPLIGTVSGGAYSGSFASPAGPRGDFAGGGLATWYRVRRSGSTYYVSLSLNGDLWGPEASLAGPTSPTRLGVGSFFSTVATWQVDFFDVA